MYLFVRVFIVKYLIISVDLNLAAGISSITIRLGDKIKRLFGVTLDFLVVVGDTAMRLA